MQKGIYLIFLTPPGVLENCPRFFKNSIIIPILKPGKNVTICKSYRPISLTCILCKLMERIIPRRIMDFLIKHNLFHFYQTAYRAKHSTVEQLFYLSQSIINGLREKPHRKTVAVFLDLSAAFDRVWRQKPYTYYSQYRDQRQCAFMD
ncbi:reverse transcriptase domain-containing protein [Caerostris darwini]|uniref:Reverse transcriptase domain-containing protein n=1 Tax=Caerostris darwini TaxID=1538125 RepID=A0AAV4Q9V2_9ARAC|nr:reverse transcriptase domain-containing protein [Caerostris darwini]